MGIIRKMEKCPKQHLGNLKSVLQTAEILTNMGFVSLSQCSGYIRNMVNFELMNLYSVTFTSFAILASH